MEITHHDNQKIDGNELFMIEDVPTSRVGKTSTNMKETQLDRRGLAREDLLTMQDRAPVLTAAPQRAAIAIRKMRDLLASGERSANDRAEPEEKASATKC